MSEGTEQSTRDRPLLAMGVVLAWDMFKYLVRAVSSLFSPDPASHAPGTIARNSDKDEDQGNRSSAISRERLGTLFVVCAFAVALAGGVGFLFLYWTGSNNWLLGVTLALFFAGLGSTLVLWAHWLMRHTEAIEPREVLPSSTVERDSAFENFKAGEYDVQRRGLFQWMVAIAVGVFATVSVSLLRSLGTSPNAALHTTVWKRGQPLMTESGKPVSVNSLQTGSAITVFPEDSIGSERAQTVLIRVREDFLKLPNERSDWAPMGYVAYSRVCTHAGCPVGLFEATTNLLLCPCHQSTFDVLRAAQPTGGPAARPLPQLPLYADADGILRAGGGFSEPPGPGFWGMP